MLLCIILASACLNNQKPTATEKPETHYRVISAQPYNKTACVGTEFHHQEGGFNTGLSLALVDEESGQPLESGRVSLAFPDGSGGSFIRTGFPICDEQINTPYIVVFVSAKGHTPLAFRLEPFKDQTATVEVPLAKSCSGIPSYHDNHDVDAELQAGGNESMKKLLLDEKLTDVSDAITETIMREFNLTPSEYKLTCVEADFTRGGFIKAKGLFKNETQFQLYHQYGWCSSGGSECGWQACITSTKELIQKAKTALCPRLSARQGEYYPEEGVYSVRITEDDTNETIQKCLEGGFDQTRGDAVTLSLTQTANRYSSTVDIADADCMAL
jgi:hypothetical protein